MIMFTEIYTASTSLALKLDDIENYRSEILKTLFEISLHAFKVN